MHSNCQKRLLFAVWNKRTLAWLAVIAWMFVIFHFSSEIASVSGSRSKSITKAVRQAVPEAVKQEAGKLSFKLQEFLVRKFFHVAEFAVLTILIYAALRATGVKCRKSMLLCIALSLLYACLDEFHQLFTVGREGKITDVAIDSIGILAAAGAIRGYETLIHPRKES